MFRIKRQKPKHVASCALTSSWFLILKGFSTLCILSTCCNCTRNLGKLQKLNRTFVSLHAWSLPQRRIVEVTNHCTITRTRRGCLITVKIYAVWFRTGDLPEVYFVHWPLGQTPAHCMMLNRNNHWLTEVDVVALDCELYILITEYKFCILLNMTGNALKTILFFPLVNRN